RTTAGRIGRPDLPPGGAAAFARAVAGRRSAGAGAAPPAVGARRRSSVLPDQASLLRWRMARCFSRCQSRSLAVSRLSCSFLPLARAFSSLTLLPLQYIAVGTRV